MMEPAERRIEILLVEDNSVDTKVLERCLRNVTFPYDLSTISDGAAAIAFLERQAPYTRAPRPDLLLLDIHLPKKSGWDVLAWVRAQSALSHIPVVMLTGIFSLLDEERIGRLQPTRCLLKPRDPEDYLRVGAAIEGVLR
jgi:two-component system, chemotaxis family, response regulator Rcp1